MKCVNLGVDHWSRTLVNAFPPCLGTAHWYFCGTERRQFSTSNCWNLLFRNSSCEKGRLTYRRLRSPPAKRVQNPMLPAERKAIALTQIVLCRRGISDSAN